MMPSLAGGCQSLFLHSRELLQICDHRPEELCQWLKVFASGMRRLEFPVVTVAIKLVATVAQAVLRIWTILTLCPEHACRSISSSRTSRLAGPEWLVMISAGRSIDKEGEGDA